MLKQDGSLFTCLNPHISIIQVDYYHHILWIEAHILGSYLNNKNMVKNMKHKIININYIPQLAMVVIIHYLEYDLFGVHIFAS